MQIRSKKVKEKNRQKKNVGIEGKKADGFNAQLIDLSEKFSFETELYISPMAVV